MFGLWVIYNNGMVPSILTFKRTPSRFATRKVYSISVFLSLEKQNCPSNKFFAPFGSFFTGTKVVLRPLFSVCFHFHAHFFFHGHVFRFFTQVRNLLLQGPILEFDYKSIIWGYKIVFIWKTGKFCFSPVLFKSFSDFFSGTFFHANYFSNFSLGSFFYG